jgi:uncharacterized protein DUF3574
MTSFQAGFFPVTLICLALLTGCQTLPNDKTPECSGEPWEETTLYMGRGLGMETEVKIEEWNAFVSEEVTPRFPSGFTIFNAKGAWRNRMLDSTIYERTKVLVILHPGTTDTNERVNAVAEAYRARFTQDAVLGGTTRSCVTFHTGS